MLVDPMTSIELIGWRAIASRLEAIAYVWHPATWVGQPLGSSARGARQVKMGSDAREVLRPSASNTRALEVSWHVFFLLQTPSNVAKDECVGWTVWIPCCLKDWQTKRRALGI